MYKKRRESEGWRWQNCIVNYAWKFRRGCVQAHKRDEKDFNVKRLARSNFNFFSSLFPLIAGLVPGNFARPDLPSLSVPRAVIKIFIFHLTEQTSQVEEAEEDLKRFPYARWAFRFEQNFSFSSETLSYSLHLPPRRFFIAITWSAAFRCKYH
jgi:hypothetical protein